MGKKIKLENYLSNGPVLINFWATWCAPCIKEMPYLDQFEKKYKDKGLVVLAVPSNDFGGQEPGTANEIKTFCEVTFGVDFPMTEKVSVSGSDPHPFYQWAKTELGARAKPRWNFHKYVVGRDGELIDWFSSITSPNSSRLTKSIERALR